MKGTLHLLIVDDHNLVCDGLKILLEQTSFAKEVASIDTAYGGATAVRKALEKDYDLILMDVQMPGTNGIAATKQIIKKKPYSRILAISMYDELELVKSMLKSGASGYLLKDSGIEKLVRGIRTVIQGKRFFSNRISLKLIEDKKIPLKKKSKKRIIELTAREQQILRLIYREKTNFEIAKELEISKRTVDAHRLNILKKVGVKNTVGLVKFAMTKGIQ